MVNMHINKAKTSPAGLAARGEQSVGQRTPSEGARSPSASAGSPFDRALRDEVEWRQLAGIRIWRWIVQRWRSQIPIWCAGEDKVYLRYATSRYMEYICNRLLHIFSIYLFYMLPAER